MRHHDSTHPAPLPSRTFVVTGVLSGMTRNEAEQALREAGALSLTT